jgi:hypothetical protein
MHGRGLHAPPLQFEVPIVDDQDSTRRGLGFANRKPLPIPTRPEDEMFLRPLNVVAVESRSSVAKATPLVVKPASRRA